MQVQRLMLPFHGTFNRSQFVKFIEFARKQTTDVIQRKIHLAAERDRVGTLRIVYDPDGTPTAYEVYPKRSYLGGLIAAYEILGGSSLGLQVRGQDQPVFLLRGDETRPAQLLSSGEVMGQAGLADGESAEIMASASDWLRAVYEYRRSDLERKIYRAVDYSDQLQAEISLLSLIPEGADTEGSLEHAVTQVEQLFSDPSYRAVWDDLGQDPLGRRIYAPLLPYSPGPERAPSEVYGRDEYGFVSPGDADEL